MHVPFAALFFFAILTLWVPGYWPVTVFQVGIFALAAIAVWRARLSPPTFAWPLVPLSFAVLCGLFQWLPGRTAYAVFIEAVLPIALYLAVRRQRESLLYSGMAAIMYASVIASASRAGTVLTTAEVVLVPLLLWVLRRATGRNVAASLLRMGLLFAVFTAVVGWESVWSRFWAPDPLLVRRELTGSP